MKLKDATRSIGSVGSLLTILVILLISAGAAYACPEHSSKVVYRTYYGSEPVRTTVVSYGSPCTTSMYSPHKVKYVAVRGNGYYSNAPRYAAYENYVPMSGTRTVAVRTGNYDYAPQYVVVRRQPAYVENGMSYVAMRNNYVPRTKYVAVRNVDVDDYDYAPQYVAARRAPVYQTRLLPVPGDDMRPIGYIPISQRGCGCAVSSLNDVETLSPRRLVVNSDYIDGTQDVVYKSPDYDDAYVTLPSTMHAYNVGYFHNNGDRIVPVDNMGTMETGRVIYSPTSYDSDFKDQAILDTSGTTFVSANDVEDACLSPVHVRPVAMRTRAVSYVPISDVDEYASLSRSEPTYVAANNTAPRVRYVSVADDDDDLVNADTAYVAVNDVNDCSCTTGNQVVSYIPEDQTEYMHAAPVSYRHSGGITYALANHVTYVPAENVDRTVSYVSADSVDDVDTADTNACDCPVTTSDNVVVTEPAQIADTSTEIVESGYLATGMSSTQTLASATGYRDGFEKGKDAAEHGNEYSPENSDRFLKATHGYKDDFGDKSVYRDAYRDS